MLYDLFVYFCVQLEESNRKMMEDMRREYEKARVEQEQRHSQEMKEYKDKVSLILPLSHSVLD